MIVVAGGLALYFVLLAVLSVTGAHRLYLSVVALRARRQVPPPPPPPAAWPRVLVQLPTYEEGFVGARAIAAASALRYPAERREIQLLDDSRSEAWRELALVAQRHGVVVLHRDDRAGFKAGALAHGLRHSTAELVAIFDADFVPPPEFLERAVSVLAAEPSVGLVQARWGHLNRDASWLTRAQALLLDAHFTVEHAARAAQGHAFNFNGTAGVWRRQAIDDAGGWSADTLTEDLDLSYRAQLAGWRFVYLDALEVPAELPETWLGFRAQQARWAHGGIQTARKLLGRVWRAPDWSWGQKVEATRCSAADGPCAAARRPRARSGPPPRCARSGCPQPARRPRRAQQALGRHDDQGLAPRAQHLAAQRVEDLRRRREVAHLDVVLGAELQEALEARARVLGPLALEAVREQQHEARQAVPLVLGARR
jgi:hypothetical protein